MRIEDVALRAGAELRQTFRGAQVPGVPETQRRSARARAAVVGLAVVIAAAGLVAVVRSPGDETVPAGSSSRMWRRLSVEDAFRRAGGFAPERLVDVVASEQAYVAVVAAQTRYERNIFYIWTSPDGVRWRRQGRAFGGFWASITSFHGRVVLVVSTGDNSTQQP